ADVSTRTVGLSTRLALPAPGAVRGVRAAIKLARVSAGRTVKPRALAEGMYRREILPWGLLGLALGRVDGATPAVLVGRHVACGAIPDTLIESELFGYEKGAFTGAHQRKAGQFQLAEGGSLFLDEVVNLPLPTQAKLLRALQERQVQPLGGKQPVHVAVRIVAAASVSLA